MPDLSIVMYPYCPTLDGWTTFVDSNSEPGIRYRVEWRKLSPTEQKLNPVEYAMTCTCSGWAYRGTCSHVKKVLASKVFCGWDGFVDPKPLAQSGAKGEHLCPKCHTRFVKYRQHAV